MKCDKHPDYGPLIMCSGCKDEQNTLRMRQAERIKELEHQLSCRTDKLSFRGNTVSYIYDKAKCYGNQLALAGRILSEHNLMDEFEERWNRVGSTKELSELQLTEQIEMLQQGLQFDKELVDRLRDERDRLLVSRDAPAEENARLLFLLEQCLPFIKADAAQHGGKLTYEITKAIMKDD